MQVLLELAAKVVVEALLVFSMVVEQAAEASVIAKTGRRGASNNVFFMLQLPNWQNRLERFSGSDRGGQNQLCSRKRSKRPTIAMFSGEQTANYVPSFAQAVAGSLKFAGEIGSISRYSWALYLILTY